jgi:hypothetical protein
VIQGSFLKAGQTDWAVLCTTKKITELLVFEIGSADQPTTIASFRNEFSGCVVSPMAARDFPPEWLPKDKLLTLDHDAIGFVVEFGDCEAVCLYCYSAQGTTLYFNQGQWVKMSGVSVN